MKEGSAFIQERLDRFLANPKWMLLFPFTKARNFHFTYFDHTWYLLDILKGMFLRLEEKQSYFILKPCGLEMRDVKTSLVILEMLDLLIIL